MVKKRKDSEADWKRILNNEALIGSAVTYGMSALMKSKPELKKYQHYLERHIDNSRINDKLKEIRKEMNESGNYLTSVMTRTEKEKLFVEDIAKYVTSGGLLDERGKKILLKKEGLEKKAESGFFKGFFAKRELKGEKYLDNTIEAFQDLYALFKSGDYKERMPELEKAVQTVNDMGFLNPAIEILKDYGLINKNKYSLLKKAVVNKTRESVDDVTQGIEKYLVVKEAAVIAAGLIGALMVFTSTNMTGGVIGVLGSQNIKAIGACLCLIALGSFLMIIKKRNKLKTFKNE
jgi:hypothetical protein